MPLASEPDVVVITRRSLTSCLLSTASMETKDFPSSEAEPIPKTKSCSPPSFARN
jgi:hypothetical protein